MNSENIPKQHKELYQKKSEFDMKSLTAKAAKNTQSIAKDHDTHKILMLIIIVLNETS